MAAYDIKKSVAKVGPKPLNFSLYKGEDADQLIVSSSPPTPAILKEMDKECGKTTRVLKGVCFREGDVLVFATKTPPAPQWKMQISKVLKDRKCQGVSNIELRQLGPGESDTASESGEEATPPGGGAASKGGGGLVTEWQAAREAAVRGVNDLIGKLKATGDRDAVKASGIVQQLAAAFPTGLDTALAEVEKAATSGDSKALVAARTRAKGQADACLAFLSANQQLISICEGNGFGAPVAISQPLKAVLTAIQAQIK